MEEAVAVEYHLAAARGDLQLERSHRFPAADLKRQSRGCRRCWCELKSPSCQGSRQGSPDGPEQYAYFFISTVFTPWWFLGIVITLHSVTLQVVPARWNGQEEDHFEELGLWLKSLTELSAADSSPHQGLFPFLGCMSLVRQLEIMYDHNPRPWSFLSILDDPACHPKPKATSHSRTGPPKKIEAEAKKQMKTSKGDNKMIAPAAPKDAEEHPSAPKGGPSVSPATKLELSVRKHITRTKMMKQLKKATGEERTPRDDPMRVEGYTCNIEGCSMSFYTKNELSLHERHICPVDGCGKKFITHKNLLQHREVHTETTKQLKKATGEERTPRDHLMRVEGLEDFG
ncbi:Lysine-specific demethylase 5A [Hordeum vulgare]|nr:Lysine-specific demethylase 5A [Hordeum vulgare]